MMKKDSILMEVIMNLVILQIHTKNFILKKINMKNPNGSMTGILAWLMQHKKNIRYSPMQVLNEKRFILTV